MESSILDYQQSDIDVRLPCRVGQSPSIIREYMELLRAALLLSTLQTM